MPNMLEYFNRNDTFSRQNSLAENILTNYRGKILKVFKSTRAGATVSLLVNGHRLSKKIVVIVPTIRLFIETIERDVENILYSKWRLSPKICRIPENKSLCRKLQRMLRNNPNLDKLEFMLLENCRNPNCLHSKIVNEEWDIVCLTYSKLEAIAKSTSSVASRILHKLQNYDIAIFDEFTQGMVGGNKNVIIYDDKERIDTVRELVRNLQPLFDETRRRNLESEELDDAGYFYFSVEEFLAIMFSFKSSLIREISRRADFELNELHRYFFPNKNEIEGTFNWESIESSNMSEWFPRCWRIIQNLTSEGYDTKKLQEIFSLLACNKLYLHIEHDGEYPNKIIATTTNNDMFDAIKKFKQWIFSPSKTFIVTDARLPEFVDLQSIFGHPVQEFIFGDPLNTESKQLIICDKKRFDQHDYLRYKNIRDDVKDFLKHEYFQTNNTLLVTPNQRMCNLPHLGVKSFVMGRNNIIATYYHSDIERGVRLAFECRSLVSIGLPFIPSFAFAPVSRNVAENNVVAYSEDITKNSNFATIILKHNYQKSSFTNMMGRVKDPKGIEKSVVFVAGATKDEITRFLTYDDPAYKNKLPSPFIVSVLTKGCFYEESPIIAVMWNSFTIENPDDLPVLSRIIRLTKKRGKLPARSLAIKKRLSTSKVKEIATRHSTILQFFGVASESRGRYHRFRRLQKNDTEEHKNV